MFSKDNVSFSIVDDDDDFDFDESIPVRNGRDIPSPKMSDNNNRKEIFNLTNANDPLKLLDSDTDIEEIEGDDIHELNHSQFAHIGKLEQAIGGVHPHAGPSGRQTVTKVRTTQFETKNSDSDSDDNSRDGEIKKPHIPGEYDSKEYQNLEVTAEIRELFQFITKYIPQNLSLDNKFKPFVPEFIPAVGDIDAFLKVIPPEIDINSKSYNGNNGILGLTVLDEPTTNQSDPALLHLQLRAANVHVSNASNMVVKKVDNVERNSKVIDKWIKDITDLHRSKSSPIVKYTNPMPELDDLMEAWSENTEKLLKLHGFPTYNINCSLSMYVDIVCCLFNIPIYKNKIQSLHLLFSLYAAIKNSQLYKASKLDNNNLLEERAITTDQLILE